ncbi:TPX2 (targeting protein for Xklp2) protein family [Rhynchospora pubera]|uniref:TPX2 (Targeting protein for Xklp2) protein family n=1 Tax=Rhynchospora pubera TaxID=906938 RepID=A0AAV8D0H1_9POAL|nr:TPX2 (targeting protein for Xklp2) protein family [Rhynchospora pubera]
MSIEEESDCVVISTSNGHAINSSQCDNSPRPGIEETPEKEETEDIELKARPQIHMSEMASDIKEENLDSTRVKKSISYSKSMDRTGTSTPVGDVGNGAQKPHTVSLPFALATDKRATGKPSRPSVSPVGSRNGERVLEKSSSHKIQGIATRKPLHPDNTLHPDNDDTCSVTSSITPSLRSSRSKLTVPVAPTFRIGERLEKRREFYSKLEEKHRVMEAEKLQVEARKKEEQEAAIRELRKTMMYRANPVPSFYHEPPPPKVELKKVPPTRAKSPKLTRRKSCSDAKERDGYCCRMHRNSLDSCNKDTAKIAPSTPKTAVITKTKAATKPVREKPAEKTSNGTNITVQT